ncbi:MAG: hypothetical protein KatS3mg076_0033 [Candidatus Binatia bacterium]|nr:MAG: hypothetical protein KatS3mg076_0033 [Candidatus Binatia bacterium]
MSGTDYARISTLVTAVLVLALLSGCDGDGERGKSPTPSPTPVASGTVSPVPPATPTPEPPTATPEATRTPTPTEVAPTPSVTAVARKITDASELVGGPLAVGRVGDYLLANDRIRVVVRDVGRQFSFLLTYGGNIVDADIVRSPGEEGRDNFGGLVPLVNIASTVNTQEIVVVHDGSDGEPAVLRAVGVDDLFDAIDPTNAIREFGVGMIPPSAQDVDIPVEIATEYSLAPGENWVRIETFVKNLGPEPLSLYAGDAVNGSGEVDTFVPSLGYGEAVIRLTVPYLAYPALRGGDVSYGVVPAPLEGSAVAASGFTQAGVSVVSYGQNVVNIVLSQEEGRFRIPPGEVRSYVRYFVVGDGDADAIAEARARIFGEEAGRVEGTVRADGTPAEGAVVCALRRPGLLADFDVRNCAHSKSGGHYDLHLEPGNYFLVARLEGYPYESGGTAPAEHPVEITAGATAQVDFEFPSTARLRVRVRDERGEPLPAKVILAGFERAPDPGNVQDLVGFRLVGGVFGGKPKAKGSQPFGIAQVAYVPLEGEAALVVPPGEYEVYVTHGPEFSLHRERVRLEAGREDSVEARLVRVVDTSGFVAADYHVHMITSPDSVVTREERILSFLADGIEHFVASDHDFLTDLAPDVLRLGAEGAVRTTVSDEITTFNIGHFNVWPLEVDPTSITGGALDWGRAGVEPGRDYPSLGSYQLSPAEIFAASPPDAVVQVNHFNTGYFSLGGIDTGFDPPRSFTDPARVRLDPTLENLYDDGFTALEMWIEGNRSQTNRLLEENLGDWFNLLNQGRRKTGVANSDTHSIVFDRSGQPRTYVASSTDDPGALDERELAANVNAGRAIGTNAPFVRVELEAADGSRAGLGVGEPLVLEAPDGNVELHVEVQSPLWAEFDTIEVYANVEPVPEPDPARHPHGVEVPRYRVFPSRTLVAGQDFEPERVEVAPGAETVAGERDRAARLREGRVGRRSREGLARRFPAALAREPLRPRPRVEHDARRPDRRKSR